MYKINCVYTPPHLEMPFGLRFYIDSEYLNNQDIIGFDGNGSNNDEIGFKCQLERGNRMTEYLNNELVLKVEEKEIVYCWKKDLPVSNVEFTSDEKYLTIILWFSPNSDKKLSVQENIIKNRLPIFCIFGLFNTAGDFITFINDEKLDYHCSRYRIERNTYLEKKYIKCKKSNSLIDIDLEDIIFPVRKAC